MEVNEMEFLIITGLIGAMWTLINLLFWQRIKRIETDVDKNTESGNQIRNNYIDRFEKVYVKLNEMEINIIKHINDRN